MGRVYVCTPTAQSVNFLLIVLELVDKETWEPMLKDLQAVQLQNAVRPGMRVVEAWAVDCPNHGESGKVNDVELRDNPGLTSE